jgi:hypothetical protein
MYFGTHSTWSGSSPPSGVLPKCETNSKYYVFKIKNPVLTQSEVFWSFKILLLVLVSGFGFSA